MKVKEVQLTPNPNARKFVLDAVLTENTESFLKAADAEGHALATALFGVDGVSSLLILRDFVTVNKRAEAGWPEVIRGVKKILEG